MPHDEWSHERAAQPHIAGSLAFSRDDCPYEREARVISLDACGHPGHARVYLSS